MLELPEDIALLSSLVITTDPDVIQIAASLSNTSQYHQVLEWRLWESAFQDQTHWKHQLYIETHNPVGHIYLVNRDIISTLKKHTLYICAA